MKITLKKINQSFILLALLTFASTTIAYAATLISAPTIQQATKTYTMITVGDKAPPAKVTVDTGSTMLVLERRYVSNFHYAKSDKPVDMGYGSGTINVRGRIVYADVTLNTNPKIIAKNVPIVMVPNGSFHGRAGIMGVEMSNQTSVWMHLPSPYNQMMVVNGPQKTISFGTLSNDQINQFATIQLQPGECVNKVAPAPAYANVPCWATRKIPVSYTFKRPNGQVILTDQVRTVFDTGGVLTHFFLQPIPQAIRPHIRNHIFRGKVTASLVTTNKGPINIPTTKKINVVASKRGMANSGFRVFHTHTVLFDAKDGIIGFK